MASSTEVATLPSTEAPTLPSTEVATLLSTAAAAGNAAKRKTPTVPSLEVYYQKLLERKITFSKPKPKKDGSGFTIFPQDSTQAGSPLPQMLIPRTKCPFVPGYGKFKTEINSFTPMSMELSIEDNEFGHFVLKVFQEHDRNVRAYVAANSVALFKRQLSDAELDFLHRKSIVPNAKTGGFPYLLRLKNHPTDIKTTKYFTVAGTGATGRPILRACAVDVIEAFSELMNSVDFSSVYCVPKQFGSTLTTRKCLHWAPVKRGRNADADDDMTADDMGDFEVEAPTTEAPCAGASSEGASSAGASSAGASSEGASSEGDDAHDNKRARRSPPDTEDNNGDDAVHDTPYANSESDDDQ